MSDSLFSIKPILYLLIPIAYIIGSIPFGILVAKAKGIDLQSVGSRNIGATNVLRTAGKLPAVLTVLGDSLKGAVLVMLCRVMNGGELLEGMTGISAILGHLYSIFLSFKGGKGVATSFGVLIAYSPLPALISIIVWILTALLTRYSSLAAITTFVSLPLVFILFNASEIKISFAVVLAILIILKHRDNIKRLLNGTETKIGE